MYNVVNAALTWDTWAASSKKRFISSSPYATFIAEPLVRCKQETGRDSASERKQKATGEEERQANKRTYKLQMIVQNTHYLSIASLLPSGTRSGNSQAKEREGDEKIFRSKSTAGSWKQVQNLVIKKQQI